MSWSSWGVDTCATFAPEYKDTVNDTKLALRSACTLHVRRLHPPAARPRRRRRRGDRRPLRLRRRARDAHRLRRRSRTSSSSSIVGSFLISMNTATADGGRALYGIARDHMTIKQLYHLNRHHVPGRAMTIDMVAQHLLRASSSGTCSASSRRATSATCSRTSSRSRASSCSAATARTGRGRSISRRSGCRSRTCSRSIVAVFTVIGVGWFQTSAGGYGGTKEKVIGFSVLAISILLFLFRRHRPGQAAGRTGARTRPTMPDARQQALIDEAARPVA